jgi:hypothetical protein
MNCTLTPGSPFLPKRPGIDADHTKIFEAREQERGRRPTPPPMANLPGFKFNQTLAVRALTIKKIAIRDL